VENKGGVCPLTMFWQRYYVPPEEDDPLKSLGGHWFGEEEDGGGSRVVNVRHADRVWRVLRYMAEATYHKSLADNFRGVEESRPRCFRTNVVRARFDGGKTVIEMKQFAVKDERRRRFRPLVAFASFKETTPEMISFAIARCRAAPGGRAKCATDGEEEDYDDGDDGDDDENAGVDGVDEHGDTPLHVAASFDRSVDPDARCTNGEMFSALIDADPTAARRRNLRGEYPISRAILVGIGWEDGLRTLLEAFPEVLTVDNISYAYRLYPFMLAGCSKEEGRVDVDIDSEGRGQRRNGCRASQEGGADYGGEEGGHDYGGGVLEEGLHDYGGGDLEARDLEVCCERSKVVVGGMEYKDLKRLDCCYRLLRANPEGVRCGIVK